MMYCIRCMAFLLLILMGCKEQDKKTPQPSETTSRSVCGPVTTDKDWYLEDNIAPVFEGLGDYNFPITTENDLAQKYFDQGMVLAYGFNHAEAARSFYYATKLDPDCAMAFMGYAYVLGPNYNAGMEDDNYERAYEAIQTALKLSESRGTSREKDLIQTMALRYVSDPPEDRSTIDKTYSDGMKALSEKYPDDPDIGVLFAESRMNLHPWDLYDKDGDPKPWTPEILKTLENILERSPDHCGANHFYIHAVEASSDPGQGIKSAATFDAGLIPNAGHLVHMPSHIYIRTGDYHKGTLANINAIKVDSTYVTACHAQGAYPLAYFPHNQHFLAATATLEGNKKWAIYAADEVSLNANKQLMSEAGWGTLQHYFSIPYYVYVKFAMWDEILLMQEEAPGLNYPKALWHYARGMAFLGVDKPEQAAEELQKLTALASDTSLKEITIWDINTVYDLVKIAEKVLRGESLAKNGKYKEAITHLKEAVAIEDALNYNEPPDWFFSVRHHLGMVLLQAEMYDDAITTYREDLVKLPENGWALSGLAEAYSRSGNTALHQSTIERFNEAWANADVKLYGSVVGQQPK